eukprot:gene14171-20138_t
MVQVVEDAWHPKAEVVERAGGLDIQLSEILDADPDTVYSDRNPERIYRGLEEVTYRRMLEDDGQGRRHFEVGHKAIAHFFCISFHIETCSLVWEDDNEKVIRFKAAKEGGTMKAFDGIWHIRPLAHAHGHAWKKANHNNLSHADPPRDKDKDLSHPLASKHPWLNMLQPNMLQPLFPGPPHKEKPLCSIVSLEQRVVLRFMPPPGIKGGMMKDLTIEIKRRQELQHAGDPEPVSSESEPRNDESTSCAGL